VILGNLDPEGEKKYWPAADRGVFPGSSSNHHLNTLPALVVATREMQKYGREYAVQIVRNAQALGRRSGCVGYACRGPRVWLHPEPPDPVNVSQWGSGVEVAKRLEDNDIIVNYNMLPAILIRATPPACALAFPK